MVQIEIVGREIDSVTFALEDGTSVTVRYDREADRLRVESDNPWLMPTDHPTLPFPASEGLG